MSIVAGPHNFVATQWATVNSSIVAVVRSIFAHPPSVISNSSVVAGAPNLISDSILGKSCWAISLLISFTFLFKTLLEIISGRGERLRVGVAYPYPYYL